MRPFQGLKLSFVGFPEEEKKHMEETAVENGVYLLLVLAGNIFPWLSKETKEIREKVASSCHRYIALLKVFQHLSFSPRA